MSQCFAAGRNTVLFTALLLGSSPIACGSGESDDDAGTPSGLDGPGIEFVEEGVEGVSFRLRPGSAPPGAEVHILNLDDDAEAIRVPTDSEGGASFTVTASEGDEVRLQLVTETQRHDPVDYVLSRVDGLAALSRSPRHSCLELEPGTELGFELTLAQFSVYNDCADSVRLSEPRLRIGELGGEFELITLMPVELGGGLSAGIEVRLTDAANLPAENVLLLDAEVGSERLRYAIGLYAPR